MGKNTIKCPENYFTIDAGTIYSEDIWGEEKKGRSIYEVNISDFVNGKKVLWFIDDEKPNRDWFVDHHINQFCIITFSSKKFFDDARNESFPVDAVVTDIFFPDPKLNIENEKDELYSIYYKMGITPYEKLNDLWNKELKKKWVLDGFLIAEEIRKKTNVPVFLFSRKALSLLAPEELLSYKDTSINTYWINEKVSPDLDNIAPHLSKLAATVQADRIFNVLDSQLVREILPINSGRPPRVFENMKKSFLNAWIFITNIITFLVFISILYPEELKRFLESNKLYGNRDIIFILCLILLIIISLILFIYRIYKSDSRKK